MKEQVIQGRKITQEDLEVIGGMIRENPSWHRSRLSQELCRLWGWQAPNGQLKDMACRSLLLKLERQGFIKLPKRIQKNNHPYKAKHFQPVLHDTTAIQCPLKDLLPLRIRVVGKGERRDLFQTLLRQYHYLGYGHFVGENLAYLVTDRNDRPLSCILFGSAAWKIKPRDDFIGWERDARERNINLTTNNTRFLILPWVTVPHLASHVLGKITRRLKGDWMEKYRHPVHLLETFVDQSRFLGTCYKAANWIHVGSTTGRTRQDRNRQIKVSLKDIYLYPLTKNFREGLK